MAHANGWHRETAARLLYQRRDKTAVPALENLVVASPVPVGRMHALYALSGLDALTPTILVAALADVHPRVREHARAAFRESRTRLAGACRKAVAGCSRRGRSARAVSTTL